MLPFLKPKKQTGLIIAHRIPDGGSQLSHEEGDDLQALESAAEEIIRAIQAKDARQLANAIKDAFDICESTSHEEGEPIESKEE